MSKRNGNKPPPKVSQDLSGIEAAMKSSKAPSIIHHRGDLNKVTFEGIIFERQEHIFLPSFGMLVKCAPYDDHFILYDARRIGWTIFCTCGSPAVVVGYDAYKNDASNQGSLLVCYSHAGVTPGKHMPVNK